MFDFWSALFAMLFDALFGWLGGLSPTLVACMSPPSTNLLETSVNPHGPTPELYVATTPTDLLAVAIVASVFVILLFVLFKIRSNGKS